MPTCIQSFNTLKQLKSEDKASLELSLILDGFGTETEKKDFLQYLFEPTSTEVDPSSLPPWVTRCNGGADFYYLLESRETGSVINYEDPHYDPRYENELAHGRLFALFSPYCRNGKLVSFFDEHYAMLKDILLKNLTNLLGGFTSRTQELDANGSPVYMTVFTTSTATTVHTGYSAKAQKLEYRRYFNRRGRANFLRCFLETLCNSNHASDYINAIVGSTNFKVFFEQSEQSYLDDRYHSYHVLTDSIWFTTAFNLLSHANASGMIERLFETNQFLPNILQAEKPLGDILGFFGRLEKRPTDEKIQLKKLFMERLGKRLNFNSLQASAVSFGEKNPELEKALEKIRSATKKQKILFIKEIVPLLTVPLQQDKPSDYCIINLFNFAFLRTPDDSRFDICLAVLRDLEDTQAEAFIKFISQPKYKFGFYERILPKDSLKLRLLQILSSKPNAQQAFWEISSRLSPANERPSTENTTSATSAQLSVKQQVIDCLSEYKRTHWRVWGNHTTDADRIIRSLTGEQCPKNVEMQVFAKSINDEIGGLIKNLDGALSSVRSSGAFFSVLCRARNIVTCATPPVQETPSPQ